MSKQITVDQSHAVMSILATNADWSSVDPDRLQGMVMRNPTEAGRQFTAFLKAGARMPLGDLLIATASFDVEEFVGCGWKILENEQDNRSLALKEVDFFKADFLTCLNAENKETCITGEVKLSRLKGDEKRIRYGATVFMGLWLNYKVRGKDSVLEKLYQSKVITYIDFFGDVLVGPNGDRYVLCLYRRDDGVWGWVYDWLDNDWRADNLSAVSSQVS